MICEVNGTIVLRLLTYLLSKGVATSKAICPPLAEGVRGLPGLTDSPCSGPECSACADVCPTDAIKILKIDGTGKITLDLGSCIACGLCVDVCPTGTIVNDPSTKVATTSREALIISNDRLLDNVEPTSNGEPIKNKAEPKAKDTNHTNGNHDGAAFFRNSVAARVVSTGCTGCDLEIGASGNPIFDIERFGVHVVASPRFADVLMVTGPVSKSMQAALLSCYEAMAHPKRVIAVGTCAISGGVHRGGYADANGVTDLLPVDVFIPGCPPHPWNIVHGVRVGMGQDAPRDYKVLRNEL